MDIKLVRFSVRLDVTAIQERASLKTWAEVLGMVPADPKSENAPGWVTWDLVYQELATILIGSGHYKAYSTTALSDHEGFMHLARTLEVNVSDEEPEMVPAKVEVMPKVKVVTPPLVVQKKA